MKGGGEPKVTGEKFNADATDAGLRCWCRPFIGVVQGQPGLFVPVSAARSLPAPVSTSVQSVKRACPRLPHPARAFCVKSGREHFLQLPII